MADAVRRCGLVQHFATLLIASCFSSLVTSGATQTACDGAWERRLGGDSCYMFVDRLEFTWSDGQEMCQQQGGSLVAINSKDEESYIAGRLSSLTSPLFWLGASDIDQEAGWVWSDGSPFSYFNWKPGQPDDYRDEDCVILNRTSLQWLDLKCDLKLAAICEINQDNLQSPQPHSTPQPQADRFYGCEKDWMGYRDRCYLFHAVKKTWSEAQLICRQDNAELVSISDEVENNFIWSQLPSGCQDRNESCAALAADGKCPDDGVYSSFNCRKSCGLCDSACANAYITKTCDYWASIGECTKNPFWMWPNCAQACGCDPSINEGYWTGLNDRTSVMNFAWSDLSPITFTYWMRQEPNNYQGKSEDCVLMHSLTGEWSDELCDTPSSGFVCEKPKTFMDDLVVDASGIGCSLGSIGYKGSCYSLTTSKKSWPDAKVYCERMQGWLAVVPDRKTNAFLASQLLSYEMNSNFWVGLSATNKSYGWVDGSKPEFGAWTANHTGREMNRCVSLSEAGLWNPDSCEAVLPFVCEKPRRGWTGLNSPTPGSAILSTGTPTSCPAGWAGLGTFCYKVTLNPESWFFAQSVCESQGGSLVTVHNQDTNDFFFNALVSDKMTIENGELWIGLHDSTKGGGFVWVDGTSLDYQAWERGQPDSFTLLESCGQVVRETRKWALGNCHRRKPFICQLRRGGLYISQATIQDNAETTTGLHLVDRTDSVKGNGCDGKRNPGSDINGSFDPDTVNNAGNGMYQESKAKTAAVKAAPAKCPGISKGWIAGIVICVACVCTLVLVLAIVVIKKRSTPWQHGVSMNGEANSSDAGGFDNALYKVKQREEESGDSSI